MTEKCSCMIHRYHVAHICACERIISHSQGDWDKHKHCEEIYRKEMLNFPSSLYEHGDLPTDIYRKLIKYLKEKLIEES